MLRWEGFSTETVRRRMAVTTTFRCLSLCHHRVKKLGALQDLPEVHKGYESVNGECPRFVVMSLCTMSALNRTIDNNRTALNLDCISKVKRERES